MLGDFKMLQGEFAAALKAFQQAQERSEGIFSIGCAGRAADAAYALYTQNRNDEYLKQAITTYSQLLRKSELPADFRYQTLYRLGRALEESKDHAGALRQYREILYSALLAKRSSQPYPAVWCSKALDEALKLLMQAVRESGADEAVFFKQEAERLLKTAGELSLPGENIKQQLETVQKTRPQ